MTSIRDPVLLEHLRKRARFRQEKSHTCCSHSVRVLVTRRQHAGTGCRDESAQPQGDGAPRARRECWGPGLPKAGQRTPLCGPAFSCKGIRKTLHPCGIPSAEKVACISGPVPYHLTEENDVRLPGRGKAELSWSCLAPSLPLHPTHTCHCAQLHVSLLYRRDVQRVCPGPS